MAGWFRNKIKNGVFTTKDTVKKVLNYEEAKDNWKTIKDMSNKMLKPTSTEQKGVQKTFHETVFEQGLTQADLNQIYFNYAVSFYISALFAVICLISGMYSAFFNSSFIGFILGLSIFSVCLASMFRFSFNSFKVRHQKFCSIQDWWNNSSQWFPKLKL